MRKGNRPHGVKEVYQRFFDGMAAGQREEQIKAFDHILARRQDWERIFPKVPKSAWAVIDGSQLEAC